MCALIILADRYGLHYLQSLCEGSFFRQAYVLHCEYRREQQRRREQRLARLQEATTTAGCEGGSMEIDGQDELLAGKDDGDDGEEEEEEDPIVTLVSCWNGRSVM